VAQPLCDRVSDVHVLSILCIGMLLSVAHGTSYERPFARVNHKLREALTGGECVQNTRAKEDVRLSARARRRNVEHGLHTSSSVPLESCGRCSASLIVFVVSFGTLGVVWNSIIHLGVLAPRIWAVGKLLQQDKELLAVRTLLPYDFRA